MEPQQSHVQLWPLQSPGPGTHSPDTQLDPTLKQGQSSGHVVQFSVACEHVLSPQPTHWPDELHASDNAQLPQLPPQPSEPHCLPPHCFVQHAPLWHTWLAAQGQSRAQVAQVSEMSQTLLPQVELFTQLPLWQT